MIDELAQLASRRVVLFGGKGGVGKTTLARFAEQTLSESRRTILFAIESLDANALYARFLERHLEPFLEIADRGTYLDREELRRFFELSLPGVDELMAWMHIGELAEENPDALVIVDTAPTGHTLRMLSSSQHFRQLALALDAMQEKHRALVRQFTRRESHDALDAFIEDFDARAQRRRELLTDPARTAFVPVMLSEPWVVEQTLRLMEELGGIDVPFVVLNRAVLKVDCALDERRVQRDAEARARMAPRRVVDFERWCSAGFQPAVPRASSPRERRLEAGATAAWKAAPLLFFAGKGGVGKTTCAASLALQLAQENPQQRYTVISVDPAHSLRDVFAHEAPPPNLEVEIADTRAQWRRFRDTIGEEITRAIDSLTPRGMSLEHDSEAMRRLVEIAPPGADELFAVTRLADLAAGDTRVIVDTAPTGHFLRLLDLPSVAGAWVREFMRILLHYRDLIPAGSLGEELVRASRALKDLDETLRSDRAAVIVVTRAEAAVVEETLRLIAELERRQIRLGGVIANYLTPENECACDRTMRASELAALAPLDVSVTIERRDAPPTSLAELSSIVKR
ncbi:MAG TPA: ArsA-related P-loop ATPase [Thermoanaerobaculia bacterium]|nr:ArsA-related P-loop ATPase [Thermoanaerobaculia bacterium]